MSDLSKESVPPCKICGKVWTRKDAGKWVYYQPIGVVCIHHQGVKEWYMESLQKEGKP